MDFPDGLLNLFVTEIGEPSNNLLRIVVAEAILGEPEPAQKFFGIDLGEGRPMEITDRSRRFEVSWHGYVAYAVRNESYWKPEENEPPFERHLIQRFNSVFLRFVSETTFADDHYPGPLQHWVLLTHTHCIDVVSVKPPCIAPIQMADDNPPSAYLN